MAMIDINLHTGFSIETIIAAVITTIAVVATGYITLRGAMISAQTMIAVEREKSFMLDIRNLIARLSTYPDTERTNSAIRADLVHLRMLLPSSNPNTAKLRALAETTEWDLSETFAAWQENLIQAASDFYDQIYKG